MSDDDTERTDDPYALPGTGGVLRNKRGIETWDELERLQANRSFQRAGQLVEEPIEGRLDLEHLQEIHHHLFQDVYDWAGEVRVWDPFRAETTLGGASVEYPRVDDPDPSRRLDARLDAAFEGLAGDDHLKGLETQPERFVERLATHMTSVWKAHAFRDGNTRATSAFFRQVIVEAGYSVSHGFPLNPRDFRDALALAAHTGDARRLQAGLAGEIDAGPRLHALGDVGRDDPTPEEAREAGEALERRTVHEIDALRHGHYTAMKSIETRLDALSEALQAHLNGRDAAEAAGPVEKALFDERWKELDTAYYTLAEEHAERTDTFELDQARHAMIARDRAERALPDDTILARRGHDAAAFRDAMARWDVAEYRLEDAPEDPEARRALVEAVRRVRESPGNLARLNDGQRETLVARYQSLGTARAETTTATTLSDLAKRSPKRDPSVARTIVARERLARETARQLEPEITEHRARLRALEQV